MQFSDIHKHRAIIEAAERNEPFRNAAVDTNLEIARELEETREQMLELIEQAGRILRRAVPAMIYNRAHSYWLAHIKVALGSDEYDARYDTTISTTIKELRDGTDEEEG